MRSTNRLSTGAIVEYGEALRLPPDVAEWHYEIARSDRVGAELARIYEATGDKRADSFHRRFVPAVTGSEGRLQILAETIDNEAKFFVIEAYIADYGERPNASNNGCLHSLLDALQPCLAGCSHNEEDEPRRFVFDWEKLAELLMATRSYGSEDAL